jgi:kynureninase
LKTYADLGLVEVHWIEPSRSEHNIAIYDPISYLEALDSPSDLVIASVVHFATGQVLGGLDKIIAKAHGQGAKVILDTYHSAGVLNWDAPEADFAMGGCYKYLRGGPGACFLAVHPRWLDNPEFRTLDTGWFAKQEPFSYARPDHNPRGEGIQSWAESTPTVLQPYQARSGMEFTLEIGVDRTRSYTLEILAEIRQILKPHGGYTPSDPNAWGGYALLPMGSTESATRVSNLLKDEGVNTDSRSGCVRFGPDVLTSAEDIRWLASALKKVIS